MDDLLFQSHAGSIEAVGNGSGVAFLEVRFNPTLVRLRRRSSKSPRSSALMFQSHAGSIEARMMCPIVFRILCRFNPTLVRLRPRSSCPPKFLIKTVSIPRWFD